MHDNDVENAIQPFGTLLKGPGVVELLRRRIYAGESIS